jgi:HD-like signal output (HDOD) protein
MFADLSMPAASALTPDDIVREVQDLPSAPKVLPRLKQLLGDGNSAMHEIVGLIRLDPGIAARVLRVANSAYYAKGVRCFTVDEAVNRVGYDQIYELVAYAVSSQVLVRPLDVYGIEADDLWRMSVAGALAAEALAERTGQDRSVAYTVGLLHCVGMVAIDEWALRHTRSLVLHFASFPREATEGERAALGCTQAEVGGALLRHWDFPANICEPVRWQYAPRATAVHARMACLLFAAKWLRNAVCGRRPPLPDAAHLAPLGLAPGALGELALHVHARLANVSTLLDAGDQTFPERAHFPAQSWRG